MIVFTAATIFFFQGEVKVEKVEQKKKKKKATKEQIYVVKQL